MTALAERLVKLAAAPRSPESSKDEEPASSD